MTSDSQCQAVAYQRQMAQLLGNPLDALTRLGYAALAAQPPSKFEKALAYAAQVRARKPEMQVRRVAP